MSKQDGSLLLRTLERLDGKRVVIVMSDERSFKGTVGPYDDHWLSLRDVSEGSTVNARGWEEVTINTGYVSKRLTTQGTFSEQAAGELVRLKDVLVNLNEVVRVWEWEPPNVTKPKHTRNETRSKIF